MPERQCRGCTKQDEWGCRAFKYQTTEENPAAQPALDGTWWAWDRPAHLPLSFDGEETYACPRQDLKERPYAWHRMFLYYGMYKAGHLPQSGSVMDQANKAVEVFRVFEDVNAECDRTLMEQRQQDQQPDGRPKKGPGSR